MEKIEETSIKEKLGDLPVQTENPAFKPEEMIACAKCARTNPPIRSDCFYCGSELEISGARNPAHKPRLRRKLESWEKGYNLIYLPEKRTFNETNAAELAKTLNSEKESLRKIFEADDALPLARAVSEKEAEIIQNRLRELGIKTLILSDEVLAVEKPHRRLRGLEFSGDKIVLILFNADETAEVATEDFCLIVTGAIFERRLEAVEKRGKKGENKILQTAETASDEFLFDVYSRRDSIGYRILAKGFDFSCLGAEKEILAKDNLKKLVQKLREFAPNVKSIENYLQIREKLAGVWETEERSGSQGLKRQSFGSFNLENVTIVSNSAQFNKYSRLQWRLL